MNYVKWLLTSGDREMPTPVTMKTADFWHVTPCSLVELADVSEYPDYEVSGFL
jgi:hypothetical protein